MKKYEEIKEIEPHEATFGTTFNHEKFVTYPNFRKLVEEDERRKEKNSGTGNDAK